MTRPFVKPETFKKITIRNTIITPLAKPQIFKNSCLKNREIFFRSVFSSAKPVTLVDVLGNILADNELSCGTNDHRVFTSDRTCGSGRPDSWGLLYAQWTRDCWCGRHRKDVVLLRRAEPFSGVLGSGGPFLSG